MCDQRSEMPGGDGEEPALPSATGGDGGEERVQSERLAAEECGVSGGEVRQEDEEMTSGSHDSLLRLIIAPVVP